MKNKEKNKKQKQKWGDALRNAYAMGFQDGYASYENLPKSKGAIVAATTGYENGATAHKKRVRNAKRVEKIDEKQKRASNRLVNTKQGEKYEEKRNLKTKGHQNPQGNGQRQKVCKV